MKLTVARLGKGLFATSVLGVIAFAASALLNSPAQAGPLCGYSLLWDCTMPNGSHRFVAGTRCDIRTFEKNTGASCVPSGL